MEVPVKTPIIGHKDIGKSVPNLQESWPTHVPPTLPVIRVVLLHTELGMGRIFGGSVRRPYIELLNK